MPILTDNLPLSLYVHVPWCVRKCPYCDFNSHELKGLLPEKRYVARILQELESVLALTNNRPLGSIFFGGGTPSLLSGDAIHDLLTGFRRQLRFSDTIEITLEANPGAVDQARFRDFYQAGINRLSIGIQSMQNDKLKSLGRIHDQNQAQRAADDARQAGFENFNLDLMYGLPGQKIDEALLDIETCLAYQPTHLSWYQLTIEPNTFFHHQPPILPTEDEIWDMQLAGTARIAAAGLTQYEVSAYAKEGKECRHNRNYWEFGDYLGLGPGAHSKLTTSEGKIIRFSQVKHPRTYLGTDLKTVPIITLAEQDLVFEFMLNALRLTAGVPTALFNERTGLDFSSIQTLFQQAVNQNLLLPDPTWLCATKKGQRFLNNLVGLFLPN